MAQFIGIAGDFQKQRALNRRSRALIGFMIGLYIFGSAMGVCLGFSIGRRGFVGLALEVAAMLVAIPAFVIFKKRFDSYLRLARAEEDGADGEREIIPYLKGLPDTYTVVSDLDFADSYGNIDHLVIGPTGLYAIDVKNWKGTVAADGKGELLLNGKPTDKPQVRYFIRRTMELKDRLVALTKLDPYIRALFVFPRTHIQAKWGTTGHVHCLHVEQLADYLTSGNGGTPIAAGDMSRLVAAAKALKDAVSVSPAVESQVGMPPPIH
jgi:hypothetical protein